MHINWLPDRLLLHIFSQLPFEDIEQCSRVCRRWRYICAVEHLWMVKCYNLGEQRLLGPSGGSYWTLELEQCSHLAQCLQHTFDGVSCLEPPPKKRPSVKYCMLHCLYCRCCVRPDRTRRAGVMQKPQPARCGLEAGILGITAHCKGCKEFGACSTQADNARLVPNSEFRHRICSCRPHQLYRDVPSGENLGTCKTSVGRYRFCTQSSTLNYCLIAVSGLQLAGLEIGENYRVVHRTSEVLDWVVLEFLEWSLTFKVWDSSSRNHGQFTISYIHW